MTEKVLDAVGDHRLRRPQRGRAWRPRRGGSIRTSSASSSTATSRSAGTRASSAASGRSATTSTRKRNWDMRLGLGRKKIFEVRALYNDVTFIDEFLTPEFCVEQKLYTFGFSGAQRALRDREPRVQGGEGEAALGSPTRQTRHLRRGRQLREPRRAAPEPHPPGHRPRRWPRARHAQARVRVWKRPVNLLTSVDGKGKLLRYDGRDHTEKGADYTET